MHAAAERQALANTVHASDVNSWYADQVTERWSKFSLLQGRKALDDLPQFKTDLEELRKQAIERAPSLAEKAALGASLRNIQSRYYGYGTNHADGQFRTGVACQRHHAGDVGGVARPDDDRGPAGERREERDARLVVAGVVRPDHTAVEACAQG